VCAISCRFACVLRAGFCALLLVVTACGDDARPAPAPASDVSDVEHVIDLDSARLTGVTLAEGLVVPWDMDFAPDGRIFVTERPGRIRVIRDGALEAEAWAELTVFADDAQLLPESGLMGIALSPDFATTGHVYVLATVSLARGGVMSGVWRRMRRLARRPEQPRWENRIYRFTERAGRGSEPTIMVAGLPASFYHAGGGLRFGPDGMLYASIGDTFASDRAQDSTSRVGALIRYRISEVAPLEGEVFAWGLRNTQAFDWHRASGDIFGADHGPSMLPHEGGRFGRDELNVLRSATNYGWPVEAGRVPEPKFAPPIYEWTPAIAPAGLAFYDSDLIPDLRGSLLVAGLRGGLRRLTVTDSAGSWRVGEEEVLAATGGRVRSVRVGPDGAIYLTTSNRDGRGRPGAGDDRVLRITPKDSRAPARP
jgi:glucose/arabinose dehydrogenase